MGKKKRRNTPFGKNDVGQEIGSAYDQTSLVDTKSQDFIYDEVDQYNQQRRKQEINKASKMSYQTKSQKETVLSLGMDSSDDEEDDAEEEEEEDSSSSDENDEKQQDPFLANEDIVDEREEKDLDERAWGKDKKSYYGSNVTDHIIRKRAQHMHLSEVHHVATLELEAHKSYQLRMADRLKDLDHTDLLNWDDEEAQDSEAPEPAPALTITPQDADNLTTEEKLKMLKQLSPELTHLMDDALGKYEESATLYEPILAYRDQLGNCPGLDYVITKWRTCSNYCLHVLGYALLLNTHGHTTIKTHPVMETLAVYRFLFKKQEPMDAVMRPQLTALLHRLREEDPLGLCHPPGQDPALPIDAPGEEKKDVQTRDSDSDSDEEAPVVYPSPGDVVSDDARRHIGAVITKNRGLMPHRKRALKNPRIKYKTKYADKVKRRKGQIREVRREVTIYRGEQSGINSSTVKSRKLK